MELLSPAGTPEALRAAVTGGADAVYFGADSFNARMNAGNFGKEEILAAIDYCHKRGVLCHAVLNTLVSDRELTGSPSGTDGALSLAEFFVSAGIDAFIVQDVGLAKILAGSTDVPLHASTQMTIHSLDGVLEAADMGFTRAVLSRELSRDDIAYIRKRAPAGFELEIFAHGALCMSYSGQCYMSSIIGGRSGNRGRCAQPCRLPYDGGYRLSLRDMCMIEHLEELRSLGIDSIKLEGRMKSPEYVYTVTKKYADALRGKYVSSADIKELAEVFSRGGFTDGYYTGKPGPDMFGVKTETPDREIKKVPAEEYKRIPLTLTCRTEEDGEKASLRVTYTEPSGLSSEAEVLLQPARSAPLTAENAEVSLTKYGDTVYAQGKADISVSPGYFAPVAALNAARRSCLEGLEKMRCLRNSGFLLRIPDISRAISAPELPSFRGYFLKPDTIPENAGKLSMLRIPLTSLETKTGKSAAALYGEKICAVLPAAFHDTERQGVESLIAVAYEDFGIRDFAAGNIGQIRMLSDLRLGSCGDIRIHGDYGLNIYNSYTLNYFRERELSSLLLTFEAPLAQLRDMAGADCGIIAYGRLPFMITRNCVKSRHGKPEYLRDRKGKEFLLTCDYGCRNRLFNADTLWLSDKPLTGFGFCELYFTDEDRDTAAKVIEDYLNGEGEMCQGRTRGRYFSSPDTK